MKIQLKNIGFFLLILTCGVFTFTSCENKDWDEHYSINKEIVSGKTLWETIKANPNLSKFAWVLKKTGYNKILSSSQMFTVWAPVDSVVNIDTTSTTLDSVTLAKQFVENHLARYSYSASGARETRVSLLNKKVLTFKSLGNEFYFGDAKLTERNLPASNGILHILNKKVLFFSNIWEYLSKEDQGLDSIKNYLYSFDKITFDAARSIPGDVNEQGQTVYLDSVLINNNKMFYILGQLNNEDSSYNAILPTNAAWIKSYNNIKSYYRYNYTAATKITADTLQRKNTMLSLVSDLVFTKKNQSFSSDSLISTTRNVFYNPTNLIAGATKQDASNGTVYITNELKYNNWDSWNKKLIVQAENSTNRTNFLSTLYDRTYSKTDLAVSGNRYIEVTPISTSLAPTVTFEIPNTLSGKTNTDLTIQYGASYNIYCVILPSTVRSTVAKPVKVSFQLSYMGEAPKAGESGKVITTTYDNNKKYFVTNKDQITKVLVASNVSFPYCELGLKLFNVKLKVINNVTTKETVDYNRDLLIDCIILEPVH